ncbi:MAG: hypothetical protein ACP5I1_16435 [Candidatus Hinthialibacter sp.]
MFCEKNGPSVIDYSSKLSQNYEDGDLTHVFAVAYQRHAYAIIRMHLLFVDYHSR